ncbi:MAG: hypothetical protein VX542_03795 [Cyanobacteriota bacterium]|nr:hypothetical protein [Cyanobacteriota bacterium]
MSIQFLPLLSLECLQCLKLFLARYLLRPWRDPAGGCLWAVEFEMAVELQLAVGQKFSVALKSAAGLLSSLGVLEPLLQGVLSL